MRNEKIEAAVQKSIPVQKAFIEAGRKAITAETARLAGWAVGMQGKTLHTPSVEEVLS